MKFCNNCGKELADDAMVCVHCGHAVRNEIKAFGIQNNGNDGLAVASKVFLIIGCVMQGWLLLPLAWCLPITISIFGKMNRGEPIGAGFKVCALIFVSIVAGIFLLCRSDEQ